MQAYNETLANPLSAKDVENLASLAATLEVANNSPDLRESTDRLPVLLPDELRHVLKVRMINKNERKSRGKEKGDNRKSSKQKKAEKDRNRRRKRNKGCDAKICTTPPFWVPGFQIC